MSYSSISVYDDNQDIEDQDDYVLEDEAVEDNDKIDPVEVELKIARNRMIECINELSDSLHVSVSIKFFRILTLFHFPSGNTYKLF